jgi:hypothetical protein
MHRDDPFHAPPSPSFRVRELLAVEPFAEGYQGPQQRRSPEKNDTDLREFAAHLFKTVEDIYDCLSRADAHPKEAMYHLSDATAKACQAVRRILETQILRDGMKRLARLQKQTTQWKTAQMRLDDFLKTEIHLIERCGAQDRTVRRLRQETKQVIADIRVGTGCRTGKVFDVMTQIAQEVCGLKNGFVAKQGHLITYAQRKETLDRTIRAILGAGMLAANAGIPDLQQLPLVALVSGSVGVELIKSAVARTSRAR